MMGMKCPKFFETSNFQLLVILIAIIGLASLTNFIDGWTLSRPDFNFKPNNRLIYLARLEELANASFVRVTSSEVSANVAGDVKTVLFEEKVRVKRVVWAFGNS